MSVEVEGLRINGIQVRDFLKEEFLQDLNKIGGIDVTALILMKKNGEKEPSSPIILNHQNAEEVKEKLIHLQSPDTKVLEIISKILEKGIKK